MPDVTLRTLTNIGDPIANPDGTPLANTAVTFDLVDLIRKKTTSLFDAMSGEVIIAQPVVVTTDASGIFSTPLWPNTRGEVATVYKVTVNSVYAKPFFIRIPDGTGTISLAAAKADIGAMTAQEISLIQALIAGVSETVSSVIDTAALATASAVAALASSESAYSSKEAAEAYAAQTGLDRTATNQDAVATAADRLQTGLDRTAVAVASEIVTNNIAAINTVASNIAVINAVTEEAIAVAADRVQTGLDRTQTAADRVATGLDRDSSYVSATTATDKAAIATTKAGEADTSAIAAAASADEAATLVSQALDGAVVGPAAAVSDDIAVFDGVSGKLVKDSGVKLSGLATSAHNHSLNDLTEKSYNSLTEKPTIPSITGLLNETSHDLLDHAGLTGIPTAYNHPTGDGNLHVPANSTTNSGKVLTAGATAGSYTWETSVGGLTAEAKTAAFTAVKDKRYICDTTASAFTCTLPATPAVGDYIEFQDAGSTWSANALTLAKGTLKINGAAEDFVCNVSNIQVNMTYVSAAFGWHVTVAASTIAVGIQFDGGSATSTYTADQIIDAGGAA